MSSHSEEIWESFDALWRQVRLLAVRVKELEARLDVAEGQGLNEIEAGFKPAVFKPREQVLRESNKTDFVYEGD
jgi:hypothetical protein